MGKQTTVYLCGFRESTEAATAAGLSTTVNDFNRVNIADVSDEIKQQAATDANNNRTFDSSPISTLDYSDF